ncbi:hypothetical protein FOXYSP1_09870 [Fusarium oxysporum f. sp. phaseoli]
MSSSAPNLISQLSLFTRRVLVTLAVDWNSAPAFTSALRAFVSLPPISHRNLSNLWKLNTVRIPGRTHPLGPAPCSSYTHSSTCLSTFVCARKAFLDGTRILLRELLILLPLLEVSSLCFIPTARVTFEPGPSTRD